jgi:histidinol-phosphatase (PHP family)
VIDLHIHTARCRHATGTVPEYVAAGRAAGLSTMCFTDHLPLPLGYPDGYSMQADELGDYVADVRRAAAAARDSGGPEVLCGIEADWIPEARDQVGWALGSHSLDVVLGSVHFIGDWAFDDPDLVGRYAECDIDALWTRYFQEFESAARSGIFDVMAHPDLVKKFAFFPAADPAELIDHAAEILASSGVAVEVNTAGLRKPVGEIYPSLPFLRACRRHGVRATTGSDAHRADEVGMGLAEARSLLAEAGYDSLVVFRRRRAEEVAL